MRKFLCALLIVNLAVCNIACSSKDGETKNKQSEKSEKQKENKTDGKKNSSADAKQKMKNAKLDEDEKQMTIQLSDGTEIVLNKIDAGSFQMGSFEGVGEEDELPVRDVTITKDYYMGVYEITQKQWQSVMGDNPSNFQGDNLPVETVNWEECMEFCEKLSDWTGLDVTLPTEAQWEDACRAGTTSRWFFGEDTALFGTYANENTDDTTMPVGSFEANPNGLYDMYGNVYEWCLDYYSPEYQENDAEDPTGPESGEARVSRGGGWGGSPDDCRSGYRNACGQTEKTDGIGFRIVVNVS